MASASYAKTLLAALDGDQKRSLGQVLDYVLQQLRIGRLTPKSTLQDRGGNLQLFPIAGTTSATPDQEFSVPHGLPSAPYGLIPCLPLDVAGQSIVPLTVTRPADGMRVYLSSPTASAPFTALVEY